ncbi:xanthine/CO dehydrogenase XdhC/CoxF family maturation factor [Hydrogenispora ethanolica]|uniref:Xanthine/CO dehydrogenase XdhC/CoxF family maturation factor n=1 Tax=Hydrogenispora ethanolica TaxID=1082276 RepID=A0A4R1S2L9_HYDET|nr:XdhC family protein [Hydrogenispora ethanolica]TCL73144.1 xanthine/CO dehydrogenase XdhC/CoxF family maturation factor [Hydrogenispora ethanolica]
MNLYAEAGQLQERGVPFAMATLIAAQGSTPRNTAKMIVKSDGAIVGTVGGGLAELYVIREAVAAIRESRSKIVEYNLNSEAADGIEMLCGGTITVHIEVVAPKPRIVMIGAGHVGFAVAKLVDLLEYSLVIVDDRAEFANAAKYPMAAEIICDSDFEKALTQIRIDGNTYIVIATKDSDLPAMQKVIRSDAAYIGMIGSKRKVHIVAERLRDEGISGERLQAVYMPVGLDIGSETPEEIAVSILAEIIKVRNGKSGLSLRELAKPGRD